MIYTHKLRERDTHTEKHANTVRVSPTLRDTNTDKDTPTLIEKHTIRATHTDSHTHSHRELGILNDLTH